VPEFNAAPGFEFPTNIEFPPDLDFQPGFDLSLNFNALNTAGSSSIPPTPTATLQPGVSGPWTDSSFLPDENAENDDFAVEGSEPEDEDDYNALADTTIRPSYHPVPISTRSANNFDLAPRPILLPALMNLPSSTHPHPVFPTTMPQPTVSTRQLTTAPGALPQNGTEMLELQRRLEIPTHLVSYIFYVCSRWNTYHFRRFLVHKSTFLMLTMDVEAWLACHICCKLHSPTHPDGLHQES